MPTSSNWSLSLRLTAAAKGWAIRGSNRCRDKKFFTFSKLQTGFAVHPSFRSISIRGAYSTDEAVFLQLASSLRISGVKPPLLLFVQVQLYLYLSFHPCLGLETALIVAVLHTEISYAWIHAPCPANPILLTLFREVYKP